jgi:signal transduction histidine kinase/CheY-like chemotaxis protein
VSDTWPILTVVIARENDVVAVRQRARRTAELLGFDTQDQTRIATAVSEIARNAFEYAGGGKAEFSLAGETSPQGLTISVTDEGGGIREIEAILEGRYKSKTGMGVGMLGARRLLDHFQVQTSVGGGTRVDLAKHLARRQPRLTREGVDEVANILARERSDDPLGILAEQNRDLVRSLDELKARQEELAQLNRELEDTNRGVVALYAELDERAEQLKQASELKSRFLSNMSHEFRTPLNSILALSRLLLDRVDGELSDEQERQVGYIRKSAESLTELVNDLLDLAKVEAGKVDVRPVAFGVADLFGGLRGALKPLQTKENVELVFEEPGPDMPELHTDEAKVAQILRNLVSNALKFTEIGEVRVLARYDAAAGRILFAVADTGIGVAPEAQERIFEEFWQVDHPLQQVAKGTGLGLPLSRRLAELLGGGIFVRSEPGRGSVFTLSLPPRFGAETADESALERLPELPKRVLIVDDEETFRYVLRQMIGGGSGGDVRYEVIEAAGGSEGLRLARARRPDVVVLDLEMPEIDGHAVYRELTADPGTRDLPIIIATSQIIRPELQAALPRASAILAKSALSRDVVASALRAAVAPASDAGAKGVS